MSKLTLADILSAPVITVPPDCPVAQALALMNQRRVSALVVAEDSRPLGIFTERDATLFAFHHGDPQRVAVGEVATPGLITASPDTDYRQAYRLLAEHGVRHLLVTDAQGDLVGIVSEAAFLDHLGTELLLSPRKVGELMNSDLMMLPVDASLEDAVRLMARERQTCIVVEQGGSPQGIFTERDLVRVEVEPPDAAVTPLGSVMSSPVHTIHTDAPLTDALQLMHRHRVRRLLVVEDSGEAVGLLSRHEIVRQLYDRHVEHLMGLLREREAQLDDVRRQLRTEEAFRLYHQFVEQSSEAMYGISVDDGRIVYVNAAATRYLGYPREELLHKQVSEISAAVRDRPWEALVAQVREQGTIRLASSHRHRDGHEVPVEVGIAYVASREGDLLLATVHDLSERKQAEARLRESEARLIEAEEIASLGGWEMDCDNGDIHWSPRARAIVGLAEHVEPDPALLRSLVHADDRALVDAALQRSLRESSRYEIEYRIRRPDGEERWVYCRAERRRDEHQRCRLSGIVQDITDRVLAVEALRESETRYRELIENMSDGVATYDVVGDAEDFVFKGFNRAAERIGGLPRDRVIGRPVREVFPGVEELGLFAVLQRVARSGEPEQHRLSRYQDSRLSQWVENYVYRLPGGEVVAVYEDATARKQAEEHLRLAGIVFDNTDEGIVIADADKRVVNVNRAFTDILGYDPDEVLGHEPGIWSSGRHDSAFYREMWQTIAETGTWRGEIWNRHKDGRVFPTWQVISTVHDADGELSHYVGVFSDITQIKRSQEQLDHLAHHDALTGLPNRILLNERIELAIRHAERNGRQVAIVFCDLDLFKHINDSFGHPSGDELLQAVARRLQHEVRRGDTVSRIGGDEFVVLLEDLDGPDHACVAVEKLLQVFSRPVQLEGQDVTMTASLGISMFPRDGEDAATLLRNADSAMYRAKDQGRNNYQFYTEELTRKVLERVMLENGLHLALQHGEFRLVYQPQVLLENACLVGVEALIRWHHPQLGLVTPATFIPIAEDSGLIHPIGQWVLRSACEQGVRWLQAGFSFGRISVNVSSSQFRRGALAEQVREVLTATGLPGECLELEITEGLIISETETVVRQLEAIRELGVTLAIDDFGTGYSSLSQLKQLPVDKLKIDQSFVRDIPDDPNDMAIARAIIAMGSTLGLRTIAEGVETGEQQEFLRASGCIEGQGYLFSRPLAAADLETLYADGPVT